MYHIKAIWVWLKENWKIPFLILWSVVIWAISRKNAQAAIDVLEARKESYQKQIISLKENHQRELSERDKNIKHYHHVVEEIEKKYNEKGVKITKANKARIKEVIEQSKENPDEVKDKIEKLFNLSNLD
jgi:hypothetical protein